MFSCRMMIPPGTVKYYYSIDDVRQEVNEDEPNIDTDKLLHGANQLMSLKVKRVNIIENIIQYNYPCTEKYIMNMKCVRRPPPV